MPSCVFCQASNHNANHANSNHRLAVIQAHLIVTAQSAGLGEPAKGSLNDPSLGQNLEAFGTVTSAHNLQPQPAERAKLLNPLNQRPQVAAVGPDDLHPSVQGDQGFDQTLGGVAVL